MTGGQTNTRVASAGLALIEAVDLLKTGELVAFATETVYGLGADARRDSAVRKIYEAKGRPTGNPLIVHVADAPGAKRCATAWPALAEVLAKHFWPGPLTMVLPRSPTLSPLVGAGRPTVAIRCPKHRVAEALLQTFDGPIAAPSANRSGFVSPTTAAHVLAELNGRVPLILDGGTCDVGLESTVIDLTAETPTVLRPGAITVEMLRETIGPVAVKHVSAAESETLDSPGQFFRHYAPHTPAFLFSPTDWPHILAAAGTKVVITHDPSVSLPAPHETILLPADAAGYAREMYAALRAADALGASGIYVLKPLSSHGLWAAVTDRLARATTPLTNL